MPCLLLSLLLCRYLCLLSNLGGGCRGSRGVCDGRGTGEVSLQSSSESIGISGGGPLVMYEGLLKKFSSSSSSVSSPSWLDTDELVSLPSAPPGTYSLTGLNPWGILSLFL